MNKRTYFPLVDLLRGGAAISVVVYHVIEHLKWTGFPISGPFLWFRIGWLGVDLFFVISGFVVSLSAFSLLDRFEICQFRRLFAIRRIARILPLHYLTCLVFLALVVPAIIFQNGFLGNLISHLGFFHNTDRNWQGAINGPNWSVGVEMQFYLLILLLAPFMRCCRWWLIPAIAFPIAWLWRYCAITMFPIDLVTGPYLKFWASTQLPGTLDQFAIGIVLSRLIRSPGKRRKLDFFTQSPLLILPIACLAMWLMLSLYWPKASFWDYPVMIVFWRTFAAFSLGMFILLACSIRNQGIVDATMPLRYLGTISYGIYLWHLPVILSIQRIEGLPPGKALVLVLVLTILLASWSWHFFERQFIAAGKPHIVSG